MAKGTMDAIHKVVTTLLTLTIAGGFKFVIDTQTEIALLKQEMKQVRSVSEQILNVVEAAHPRQ